MVDRVDTVVDSVDTVIDRVGGYPTGLKGCFSGFIVFSRVKTAEKTLL